MEWTREKMEKICKDLSVKYGDVFNVPVLINGRLTRTHGRAILEVKDGVCTPTKIEMSKQLLETATEDGVIGVLKHEWAHYYITKTTGVNHGHDRMFHDLCNRIGCRGNATGSVEREVEVQDKYDLVCSCCGKKVGGYSRKCKTIDSANAGFVTSKCCKAIVNVRQNW